MSMSRDGAENLAIQSEWYCRCHRGCRREGVMLLYRLLVLLIGLIESFNLIKVDEKVAYITAALARLLFLELIFFLFSQEHWPYDLPNESTCKDLDINAPQKRPPFLKRTSSPARLADDSDRARAIRSLFAGGLVLNQYSNTKSRAICLLK